MMASASQRPCVNFKSLDEGLGQIFNDEDSAEGMESGEESDLDLHEFIFVSQQHNNFG